MNSQKMLLAILFATLGSIASDARAFNVFSNIDGSNNGSSCGTDLAAGFATAPGGPYSVRSVSVNHQNWPSSIRVDIFADDSGAPGVLVGTVGSVNIPGSDNSFIDTTITADSAIVLQGSTNYWITVDGESGFCFLGLTLTVPDGVFTETTKLRSLDDGGTWVPAFTWPKVTLDVGLDVGCNDDGVSMCGRDVNVRCEGVDESLFFGLLEVDDQWNGVYAFGYDAGNDGEDPQDWICLSEFFANTIKYEARCTDVLRGDGRNRGNGKNSDKITIDIDMEYDELDDDC